MLLEIHFLWVFALSVQGHSGEDHKNGEFATIIKCHYIYFWFFLTTLYQFVFIFKKHKGGDHFNFKYYRVISCVTVHHFRL